MIWKGAGGSERVDKPGPALGQRFEGDAHARIERGQDVRAFIDEWLRGADLPQPQLGGQQHRQRGLDEKGEARAANGARRLHGASEGRRRFRRKLIVHGAPGKLGASARRSRLFYSRPN